LKIGYQPFGIGCTHPADLRRFIPWAESMQYEWKERYSIIGSEDFDIFLFPSNSNLIEISRFTLENPKRIMQIVDGYLGADEGFLRKKLKGFIKYFTGEISYPVFNYPQLLKRTMGKVDLLICASPEQQEYLKKYAKRIFVIPDNHAFLKEKRLMHVKSDKLEMVWEGMGVSLGHIKSLAPVFEELRENGISWKLTVLSDLEFYKFANKFGKKKASKELGWLSRKYPENVVIRQWTEATLIEVSKFADVALIPISKNDHFAELKHECKMLVYWQLGIPTLQSDIPSYRRISRKSGLEELCISNLDQWYSNIVKFEDKVWRSHVTSLQDKYIQKEHTLEMHVMRWNQAIRTIDDIPFS